MSPSNATSASPPRRRPAVAVVLSSIFPGLGQLYNREKLKALLFGVAGVVTAFGPFSPVDVEIDLSDPTPGLHNVLVASLPFLVIALWSVIDAYRASKRP
ncbi:MAG: hypothetical protein HYR72_06705 [Deltaproteobacteria bacterium]|nr:hypothetical protein [Deltaproteobacteria bacterium]MBI3387136.1 hypothetical protein [Deltaproteobacteria bacterium]